MNKASKYFGFFTASILIGALTASADTPSGSVIGLQGEAKIGRDGAWTAATIGATVEAGDQLSTAANSRVRIVLPGNAVLSLGSSSAATLNVASENAAELMLDSGKLRSLVPNSSGMNYVVRTKTAIAKVTGTEFIVAADPIAAVGSTVVLGLSGSVAINSVIDPGARGVVVEARQTTTIAQGKLPTKPRTATDALFSQYLEDLDFGVAAASVGTGLRGPGPAAHRPILTGSVVAPEAQAPRPGQATGGDGRPGGGPPPGAGAGRPPRVPDDTNIPESGGGGIVDQPPPPPPSGAQLGIDF